ncbi:MAG: PAS domain-containing protein [Chloroflexota bacterium]
MMGRVSISIRVIPSSDTAFRTHVERLAARQAFPSASALGTRLRTLFPRVLVRPSEVSGQDNLWYVYRDGAWATADASWWFDDHTPRVTVSMDGWIEQANAQARAILGLAPGDTMSHQLTDFVAPGTFDDATDLFAVVADGHELAVTMVLRPTSGELIACDVRAWPQGDKIVAAFRLADDVSVPPSGDDIVLPTLACHPAGDVLFHRYAADALTRMPEPTPDRLALRLRRLYPHARVEARDDGWTVYRDAPGVAEPTDQWWRADGLPAVRYDGQGRIFEANDAAVELLGTPLVGRHWQELVTAGTTEQVSAVLRLIADVGWAESRFRMPGADGYFFEFDSYTEVARDSYLTIMRRRAPD